MGNARIVKGSLVLAFLLACGLAQFSCQKQAGSGSTDGVAGLMEKGKTYEVLVGGDSQVKRIKVLDIGSNGWLRVDYVDVPSLPRHKEAIWLNPNQIVMFSESTGKK